ncbi:MAG: hypothetical protein QW767_06000 [Thermoprotei archaeon]
MSVLAKVHPYRYLASPRLALEELPVSASGRPDLGPDTVQYTVENGSSSAKAAVLYRGLAGQVEPYFFGNAFGPGVYYGLVNGVRVANYYASIALEAPLPANPLGVYYMAQLYTGSSRLLTCFIFVVPGRGSLKIYEGGISDVSKLQDLHAYVVGLSGKGEYCVHYSDQAVTQYKLQTGYSVVPPENPYTVETVLMSPSANNVPVNQVYKNQYATEGGCP